MRFLSSRASLIIAIATALLVCSPAATFAAPDDPFADFDAHASQALGDWKVPAVAISVVKDGRVVFARGYGVRKLGGNARVDADTVFPIASITKAFNATALAMLVDEGRVRWTDPVLKHIPEFQLHDPWMTREVTLIDCLAHRTGLADPDLLSYSGVTRAELLRRMRFLPQIAPFRSGSGYSNKGVIVAGEVLERVSGRSWSDFMRKRILEPLDMTASVPDVLELAGVENVATPYVGMDGHLEEDKSWALPLSDGWRVYRETIRPAGAICSSANDMAKFAIFQLGEGEFRGRRLVKAQTIAEMQALHGVAPLPPIPDPQLTYPKFLFGSGLGWHIRDYRGRKLVQHAGSTGALIGLVPEEKLGVVVLTNLGCGIQTVMMHDAIDRVLGFHRTWSNREFIEATNGVEDRARDVAKAQLERDRKAGVKPRLPLSEYAGTYVSDLFGKLIVEEAGGALRFRLGPNCHASLVHWSGDRFRARFVLRYSEDWFASFGVENDVATTLTIANAFPNAEIGTFRRSE
jgi:CubicO group peptidase (beta-lactamase class C family)